jgi:myo-inositol-1(or 4)-monophosphatase
MEQLDLKAAFKLAKAFALQAGQKALDQWHNLTVDRHHGGDLTTNIDREIEQSFYQFVQTHFPSHGFQGEEFPELNSDAEYHWMIDPIDGTKYYAQQMPLWCTTLALMHYDTPVLGIIYYPLMDQFFFAIQGQGAFVEQAGKITPLKVTEETDPAKLQAIYEVLSHTTDWEEHKQEFNAQYQQCQDLFYRVRNIGSGALALAWMAQGSFGAFIMPRLKQEKFVDLAAGTLITQEAGATVFRQNCKDTDKMFDLIIGNTEIVERIKRILVYA